MTNTPAHHARTKTITRPCLLAGLASVALAACAAGGQTVETQAGAAPVQSATQGEREAVLAQLADRLEAAYLFPQWGAAYAEHLRTRGLNASEASLPAEDFASLITEELQAIHADGHLRLEVMEQGPDQAGPSGPPPPPPPANFSTYIADGVAYMRIDTMFGLDETMAQLETFVAAAEGSTALVIDLRYNRGGGLREMDFLFAELFDAPTDLVVMEIRQIIFENDGTPFGEMSTLRRIEAPEGLVWQMHRAIPAAEPRLGDASVVILTSPTTASAAEHLTLALQRTDRATVIGEPSRGAAHFGGMLPVGSGFAAFIPAGRTFDPDTGESWEATGNQPHIATEADNALRVALEYVGLSGEQADAFRSAVSS